MYDLGVGPIVGIAIGAFVLLIILCCVSPFIIERCQTCGRKNPFKVGAFFPQSQEVVEYDLKFTGTIPMDLCGQYVKNVTNPAYLPKKNIYHWFDGDGMIFGVYIKNGRTMFCNKFVNTVAYQQEKKSKTHLYSSLAQLINGGLCGYLAFINTILCIMCRCYWPNFNFANTSIRMLNKRALALFELSPEPMEITLPFLETVGVQNYKGVLKHNFTAHPKVDTRKKDTLTFGYNFVPFKPRLVYNFINPDGQMQPDINITLDFTRFMHDFSITENLVIFPIYPFTLRLCRPFCCGNAMQFEPNTPTKFAIGPRGMKNESELTWFEHKSQFALHFPCSWEYKDANNDTIVELIALPSAMGFVSFDQMYSELTVPGLPHFWKYRFNMTTKKITHSEVIHPEISVEFPKIRLDLVGYYPTYIYAAVLDLTNPPYFNGLVKLHVDTYELQTYIYGPNIYGSEPSFVPRKENGSYVSGVDDGYLLVYTYYAVEPAMSELWIIDAKTFSGPPIAKIRTPVVVPYGIHGEWVDEDAIKEQPTYKAPEQPFLELK